MHEYSGLIRDQIAKLRPKLMDTSRRNPLINNTLSRRTASFIRIVDEQPNNIFTQLTGGESLRIIPLPSLEDELPDEQTPEFLNAYSIACETDELYLKAIDEIDYDNFKSEVARHQGQKGEEYKNALHRVWSVMNQLQTGT